MIECVDCHKEIIEGEGRFNFPSGARCTNCGSFIDSFAKMAEKSLDFYKKVTGYEGVRIKWL